MLRRTAASMVLVAMMIPTHGIWARPARGFWGGSSRHANRHHRRSSRMDQSGDVRCAVHQAARRAETPAATGAPLEGGEPAPDPQTAPAALGPGDGPLFSPTSAAVDPDGDDDNRLKKGRRKGPIDSPLPCLRTPARLQGAGDFLAVLRLHLVGDPRHHHDTPTLAHYGSGPCHAIPRPREGTILPSLLRASLAI